MRLEVKNLNFKYNKRDILKNMSFSADKGDLLCVLGPNGVGKSTLFKCLLGLLNTYDGEILIGGDNIKTINRKNMAKKISYIPQSSFPTFNYTVLNTVLMGTTSQLEAFSSPKIAQENLAIETLEKLGIKHLSNRGCGEISGGERQLVLIARAIVQKAKTIIMDEPTASLDYGNQIKVMNTIKGLASEGYTIIVSTHNPEHAFLYANKIMIIYQGEILEYGNPKESLTEEVLGKIYGIDVSLHDINTNASKVTVCIPKNI